MHRYTRKYTRYDSTREANLRIGHIHIEDDEEQRHQHTWRETDQLVDDWLQQDEVLHLASHRLHKNGKTCRNDDDDGEQEEHGQIVSKRADNGSRIIHLPDLVKRLFHIVDQHQDSIEHKDQSHAEEDAALGMYQIAVDETDDCISHLRLGSKQLAEPHLYIFVIAEAPCDGKHHSEHGHNGQQRRVS